MFDGQNRLEGSYQIKRRGERIVFSQKTTIETGYESELRTQAGPTADTTLAIGRRLADDFAANGKTAAYADVAINVNRNSVSLDDLIFHSLTLA